LPTMIGAKAAAPHRPAVAYAGDGAWGMSMSEIMTCVRHDIPVTAIVFHNRQWGAEMKNQVDFYNRRFVAGELDNQSFAGIARAMGAEGVVVDRLEDVGPALKAAIDAQMPHGKTTVIEIMCTRELGDPFRRDALSKPVRFLDKYKDYGGPQRTPASTRSSPGRAASRAPAGCRSASSFHATPSRLRRPDAWRPK